MLVVKLKKHIMIQKLVSLKRNHDKCIATPEFNTLAAAVFNARLPQANLITKTDFDAKLPNIYSWKSKRLSDENITTCTTSDYKLNPELKFLVLKQRQNLKEAV